MLSKQRTGDFQQGKKWAPYWGLTWDELMDLVLIGEIDEEEAEHIYYAQQPQKQNRKSGCECESVDREIARYRRRMREEQEQREGGLSARRRR